MFNPSYERFGNACEAFRKTEVMLSLEDRAFPYAALCGHLQALIDIVCTEEQLQFICEKMERHIDNARNVNMETL